MQLVIFNISGSTKTYLSGAVSITNGSSTSVTNTVQQLALATDGTLRSDIFANNVYLSDGINNFGATDGLNYLYEIVQVLGPLSDGIGNQIFSTNNALNVNTIQSPDVVVSGNITTQDIVSTSTVYFNNQTWYSGTPTPGSIVATSLSAIETGMVTIEGTWTGTLQVEISNDGGTNWLAHSIHQIGSAVFISNFTNNVTGSLNLSAKTNLRVRAISAITGTAIIRLQLSQNPSSVYVANSIKLVDGSTTTSSTTMNIVPASTSATSTNTAIVTALSPNTSLPSGTNIIGKVELLDNIGSGITSTSINSKQRLDVDLSSEGIDNTTAPFGTLQIGGVDVTGKLQTIEVLSTGEQFTRDVLNVSSQSRAQSVTTTAAEALGGSTILVNRKVLTITPTNGIIYWGSTSGVTTSSGTPLFPFQTLTLSATDNVHIYVIASATTDCRMFEGS